MSVMTLPELNGVDVSFDRCTAIPQREVRPVRAAPVRRRGSSEQGRALETLGHAVEYLVDSRMLQNDPRTARSDQQAVQLMMQLSRAVFSECPEVIPVGQRFRRWIAALLPHRIS